MIVEVVNAEATHQSVVQLDLPTGATVADALAEAFPEISADTQPIGIFGEICSLDTVLKAWDRVEIYRPLVVDAKEARRRRAQEQKSRS